jgi:hypothetical protein
VAPVLIVPNPETIRAGALTITWPKYLCYYHRMEQASTQRPASQSAYLSGGFLVLTSLLQLVAAQRIFDTPMPDTVGIAVTVVLPLLILGLGAATAILRKRYLAETAAALLILSLAMANLYVFVPGALLVYGSQYLSEILGIGNALLVAQLIVAILAIRRLESPSLKNVLARKRS